MIDSHAHLDHPNFGPTLESQLIEASRCGIAGWVIPGVDFEAHPERRALRERLRLAGWEEKVRFAVGIHPYVAHLAPRGEKGWEGVETALVADALELSAVAVGETGFDKSRPELARTLAEQERAFEVCSRVAQELRLPLILHVVRSEGEFFRASKGLGEFAFGGVIHGFTGGPESAQQYLRRGLHLSFGPALLRRGPESPLARAAREVPVDRILVETDAPDQAPELSCAHRVVEALAGLRGEDPAELGALVRKNAQSLFRCSFEP